MESTQSSNRRRESVADIVMPNLNRLLLAGSSSMTPSPYQSPREAGYVAPRPAPSPLRRTIVALFAVSVTIVYVGWVGPFAIVVAVDCLRWQLGF